MGEPAQLHADLEALVGSVIHDRYRVDSLLGTGGMGAVFRGHHTGLERDVAIKVLHPEIGRDDSVSKRFDREALSASRLDHPNCVRVTDYGTNDNGTKYLVMELLEGGELQERLTRPWPAREAIETAKQIFAGLEHAHHFGIVHRDLKPENVFITKDFRGEELVKIVDFGIAKLIDEQGAEKLTRAGLVFGTPRYMAPEQAAGGKIDPRTDLYAAGLILYEMLAGRPPFTADEPGQLLRMQIMAPPDPLPESVPTELAKIVEKLLEKSKADRYADAREVLDALEALDEPTTAAPAPTRSGAAWQPAGPASSPTAPVLSAPTPTAPNPTAPNPTAPNPTAPNPTAPNPTASVSQATILQESVPQLPQAHPNLQTGPHPTLPTGPHPNLSATAPYSSQVSLHESGVVSDPSASASTSAIAGGPAPTVPPSSPDHEGPTDARRRASWLPWAIAGGLVFALLAGVGVMSVLGEDEGSKGAAGTDEQTRRAPTAPTQEDPNAEPAAAAAGDGQGSKSGEAASPVPGPTEGSSSASTGAAGTQPSSAPTKPKPKPADSSGSDPKPGDAKPKDPKIPDSSSDEDAAPPPPQSDPTGPSEERSSPEPSTDPVRPSEPAERQERNQDQTDPTGAGGGRGKPEEKGKKKGEKKHGRPK